MKKKQKIGLLGGTFDPPHFGHLNLAVEILEKCNLDEIWFCPARVNPLKMGQPTTPIAHRLKMLELAIAGNPQFKIIDIEATRSGPSYTLDTLQQLVDRDEKEGMFKEYNLILGCDALKNFTEWYKPEEIIKLAKVIVGLRSGETLVNCQEGEGTPELLNAISKGIVRTKIFEISSTELRKRLKNRVYCDHLVPAKVMDYILSNQLYL